MNLNLKLLMELSSDKPYAVELDNKEWNTS